MALKTVSLSIPARTSAKFVLRYLAQTVASIPTSTLQLRVEVDVGVKFRADCRAEAGFYDDQGHWSSVWQEVALRGTIRQIIIRCREDEPSVMRCALASRNKRWEADILRRAKGTLYAYGYHGRAYLLLSNSLSLQFFMPCHRNCHYP